MPPFEKVCKADSPCLLQTLGFKRSTSRDFKIDAKRLADIAEASTIREEEALSEEENRRPVKTDRKKEHAQSFLSSQSAGACPSASQRNI